MNWWFWGFPCLELICLWFNGLVCLFVCVWIWFLCGFDLKKVYFVVFSAFVLGYGGWCCGPIFCGFDGLGILFMVVLI